MEMSGEFYTINACHKYPFETNQLLDFLQSNMKIRKYQATLFRVRPDIFNYDDVMDDLYEVYTVTEDLTKHLSENVLCDIVLELEDGITTRILHEYYDDIYYGISLMFSLEQLEERFTEKQAEQYLNHMMKSFLSTMRPIYGTAGVEASLQSPKDKECSISFERLYMDGRIYENICSEDVLKNMWKKIQLSD